MHAVQLDPQVEILSQLEGGQSGSVVFVAVFHVPPVDADGLIAAWYGEEPYLRERDGFISRELVRGRGGSDVFIDYAKWQSAAQTGNTLVIDAGERFEGMQAITAWNDRALVGAKGHAAITNVDVADGTFGSVVTVLADWKSAFYRGPGKFVFIIKAGVIAELRMGQ